MCIRLLLVSDMFLVMMYSSKCQLHIEESCSQISDFRFFTVFLLFIFYSPLYCHLPQIFVFQVKFTNYLIHLTNLSSNVQNRKTKSNSLLRLNKMRKKNWFLVRNKNCKHRGRLYWTTLNLKFRLNSDRTSTDKCAGVEYSSICFFSRT